MQDEDMAQVLRAKLDPVVRESGLFLEDIRLSHSGGKPRLRVVVDLPAEQIGSVDSDAIANCSQAISAALDLQDPLEEPYLLEVSSPGAERCLTKPRHWMRARTRLVEARLRSGEILVSRVEDVVDGLVIFRKDRDTQTRQIPLTDLESGTVLIEFSRPETQTPAAPQSADHGKKEA